MTCLVKAQQNRQMHFGGHGEPCAAGAAALSLARDLLSPKLPGDCQPWQPFLSRYIENRFPRS
jgi:hypothetical protein